MKVSLTADVILLHRVANEWRVLLIKRDWPPYEGCWALPGGYVDENEGLLAAAQRELREETGLTSPVPLSWLGTYDDPDRDPRGRVVTGAFVAVLDTMPTPHAGDDARAAEWLKITPLLSNPSLLAFDHAHILGDAVARAECDSR